jgi:cytochrome b pre-mRNA-processing protein 3
MLPFLFRRLTGPPKPAQKLFQAIVSEARRPHWFVEGGISDTLNGRFSVLATVCALVLVRLEQDGGSEAAAAALTERFVESMDSEHRELGLNDPGLGRRVRKLVGALARRVSDCRAAIGGERGWAEVIGACLYRNVAVSEDGLAHSEAAIRSLWSRLRRTPIERVIEGTIDER